MEEIMRKVVCFLLVLGMLTSFGMNVNAQDEYYLSVQMRGVPPLQDKAIEFGMVVESWAVPLKSCFPFSMPVGVSALRLAVRGL